MNSKEEELSQEAVLVLLPTYHRRQKRHKVVAMVIIVAPQGDCSRIVGIKISDGHSDKGDKKRQNTSQWRGL